MLRHRLSLDEADQVKREKPDRPEADHAGTAQKQSQEGVLAQAGGSRNSEPIRAELLGHHPFVAHPFPAFRFLEPTHDEQGQEGGNGTDQEHDPPGRTKYGVRPHLRQPPVFLGDAQAEKDEGGAHIPDAGKSLQECQRLRAAAELGMTSATRATPTANSPPTPSPVRKR